VIPSAPGHAPSAQSHWYTNYQVHSWGEHYRASDSHRAVLAVHFIDHRFGVDHQFQAGHLFGARWAS
jgi:hypothetical protein